MRGQTYGEKMEEIRASMLKCYRALPLPMRLAWNAFCFVQDRVPVCKAPKPPPKIGQHWCEVHEGGEHCPCWEDTGVYLCCYCHYARQRSGCKPLRAIVHDCEIGRCGNKALRECSHDGELSCGHCGKLRGQLVHLSTSTYNEYGAEYICFPCVRAMAKLVGP